MLRRRGYLGVTNALAMLRLLPLSDRARPRNGGQYTTTAMTTRRLAEAGLTPQSAPAAQGQPAVV